MSSIPTIDIETLTTTLAQFTGSQQWFRHGLLRSHRYTEGVQYLAEAAGAYWLIDAVFSHQLTPAVAREEFQAWTLQRNDDDTWTLSATDGNDRFIAVQQIEHSDFPLSTITLFLTDRCLLLRSEY